MKLKRRLRNLTEDEMNIVYKKSMLDFMRYVRKIEKVKNTLETAASAIEKYADIVEENQLDYFAKVNNISRKTVDRLMWKQRMKEIKKLSLFNVIAITNPLNFINPFR